MTYSLDWTYTWLPNLFCSDLTLESQSNLVLFRSHIWKPVKLVIQILSHAYLPRLTPDCQFGYALALSRIPTWLDLQLWCQSGWDLRFFKTLICLNYLLSLRRFFWNFYRVQYPFSLCILVSDKKRYVWYNMSCNVWLCIDEMSEHLNSFFFWISFIPLFKVYWSSRPCVLYELALLTCYASFPSFRKTFFVLIPFIISQFSLFSKV